MGISNEAERELKDAIEQALEALTNTPRVGGTYNQQYADIQLAAHRRLQDAAEKTLLTK